MSSTLSMTSVHALLCSSSLHPHTTFINSHGPFVCSDLPTRQCLFFTFLSHQSSTILNTVNRFRLFTSMIIICINLHGSFVCSDLPTHPYLFLAFLSHQSFVVLNTVNNFCSFTAVSNTTLSIHDHYWHTWFMISNLTLSVSCLFITLLAC